MINEHYIPQAVILANGEYPAHELPLRLLAEAQFVVCCDGAANEYISRGHTPDVIIGDGDSLLPEYKKRFSSIILQISDQETNDQTKAVHYLQSKGRISLCRQWFYVLLQEPMNRLPTLQLRQDYSYLLPGWNHGRSSSPYQQKRSH